jgi:dihydropteroate synthase
MSRYYTRVCNFYYGSKSKALIKKAKSLPLNGNNLISFDEIEIISRKSIKKLSIKKINDLPHLLKKIVKKDINLITKKKKFKNLNFKTLPKIMGVLNMTPDSFSDGGKYNKNYLAKKTIKLFI